MLGGHGFVGKATVKKLKETNHTVIPLSRRDGLNLDNLESTISYLKKIKPDAIVNCAAHVGSLHYVTEYAADVINDNIQMALNIYRAAAKECRNSLIINPLSNCSYPGDSGIQFEKDWLNGEVHKSVHSYGNAKRIIYIISKYIEDTKYR